MPKTIRLACQTSSPPVPFGLSGELVQLDEETKEDIQQIATVSNLRPLYPHPETLDSGTYAFRFDVTKYAHQAEVEVFAVDATTADTPRTIESDKYPIAEPHERRGQVFIFKVP